MRKILIGLLSVALFAGGSAVAQANSVVTTIKPLTLIARAVTDGIEQPVQLLPDGLSPHDYSLRPSDRQRLKQAELVIWVGPAHERFLAGLIKNGPGTLNVTALPGLKRLPRRKAEDGSPLPGSLDTHVWLDPDNAILIARAIAEDRARRQPALADRYRANAEHFAQTLKTAWQPLQQRIAALPRHEYVAYHDAYQYLEKSLNLHLAGSLSSETESRPGARHLLAMKKRVHERGITCLVREPASGAGLLQQVAGPKDRIAVLDEGLRQADSFVGGLTLLGQAMEQCLGR
ncbi:zinc transport system substrate-binding protein [Fluviicoccus keumensis]|uniref:High-affinity zinc uptake system protein ZnuA n=1 Tax=Fluviicoccus keumensis TaxID=1435465 RepID=A0A4V2G6B4_9GAMM|nr:zinc ABC transporter substrate-binding protein [Fluviicoccus keumensis]RZU48056.1 zinc transport system substrate-binding protein [Fluviicoccus keumensis]